MSDQLSAWAENRPQRTEAERSAFADQMSAHLPRREKGFHISDEDSTAMKAAFIKRFDEDLPRTETLWAVANIGYRMALRDLAAPDLLAALKKVVAIADRKTVEFDEARAAIAKAESAA